MNKVKRVAANQLIPGDIFLPGEYLLDEMNARGMNQTDLVRELELSKSEVSLIVNGKRSITVVIALKLENIFGIDAGIWMNLQVRYDIAKLKKKYSSSLQKRKIPPETKNRIRRAIASV